LLLQSLGEYTYLDYSGYINLRLTKRNIKIPASLPLYFYIAYQFIQKKNDRKEVGDSIYRKSKNNRKLVAKL
jgi:hypothetical protein